MTTAQLAAVLPDEARALLSEPAAQPGFLRSGYCTDAAIFRPGVNPPVVAEYWQRSGVAGFGPDAAAHFFQPERFVDAFGAERTLVHDADDLFVESIVDPAGNTIAVTGFDHRALAATRLVDANGNTSEVAYDARGLPVASALMGKVVDEIGGTGDEVGTLTYELLNPAPAEIAAFHDTVPLDENGRGAGSEGRPNGSSTTSANATSGARRYGVALRPGPAGSPVSAIVSTSPTATSACSALHVLRWRRTNLVTKVQADPIQRRPTGRSAGSPTAGPSSTTRAAPCSSTSPTSPPRATASRNRSRRA